MLERCHLTGISSDRGPGEQVDTTGEVRQSLLLHFCASPLW